MMSLKLKLFVTAAAATFALPAAAQVTGTRLPVQADAELQAEAQAGDVADAEVQAGAETGAPVEAGVAAEAQAAPPADMPAEADANAAAEAEIQAQAADQNQADVQTQADTQAQGGTQTQAQTGTQAQTPAGPVTAATAADVRAGVAVQDPQGGAVGTIESVDAQGAVVSTGSARAKLPLASFGKNAHGLVISMTRAELEAAVAAQSPSS